MISSLEKQTAIISGRAREKITGEAEAEERAKDSVGIAMAVVNRALLYPFRFTSQENATEFLTKLQEYHHTLSSSTRPGKVFLVEPDPIVIRRGKKKKENAKEFSSYLPSKLTSKKPKAITYFD